ncbi:MAG: retropepsin-like aspartic protease [Bacteroidia bacterium]
MVVQIPLKLLAIEGDGTHLLIAVKINGKKARLLVDTGASRTVFDINRISKFTKRKKFNKNEQLSTGLGTNSMQSHNTLLKKFEIGKLKIENFEAILLDLKHVNESYEKIGLGSIDGVLGGEILVTFKAVIDYGKKQLKLKA